MVFRIRGISNIAAVTQTANIAAASAAISSSSTRFFNLNSLVTLPTIPRIDTYVFTEAPMIPLDLTFVSSVLAGSEVRSTFKKEASDGPIADSEKNPHFDDVVLKKFYRTEAGKNLIKLQTQRRPVHILADFDYATLNSSLDGDSQDMSGAARIWARNENAREWKDWVAACFFTELSLGITSGKRVTSEDKYTVTLDADPFGMKEETDNSYTVPQNYQTVRNLINGYLSIYLVENFISSVFKATPFSTAQPTRADRIESLINAIDELGPGDEPLREITGKIKARLELMKDPTSMDYYLKSFFKFRSADMQRNFHFQLQHPHDEQGFIKAVIESVRAIRGYLENNLFYYRDEDSEDNNYLIPNYWTFTSSYNYFHDQIDAKDVTLPSGSKKINKYDPNGNIYIKAFKIRKQILKALYLKDGSNKLLYLKNLISEQGKSVIDVNQSTQNQDDIEKAMCRVLPVDPKNRVTISPYLTKDYLVKTNNIVNHFLTLKDAIEYKKSKMMEIFDLRFNMSTDMSDNITKRERLEKLQEELSRHTFDHGPKQLNRLFDSLISQFCSINEESSTQQKNALVLLDHRNLVSHLTRGMCGQTIMDAALEKLNLTRNRNDPDDLSYEIKVTSSTTFRADTAYDLSGDIHSDLLTTKINSSLGIESTEVRAAFTSDSSSVSLEFLRLLNTTLIKSLDSPRRREYIFFCILLQLSDFDRSGRNPNYPFFIQYDADRVNDSSKLPSVADSLYAEYISRVADEKFTSQPGNEVQDFFKAAGLSGFSNMEFSQIDLSTKAKANRNMLDDMREFSLDLDTGSAITGAFDEIISLQDRVNHLPIIMDLAANMYRNVVLDVADRLGQVGQETRVGSFNRGENRRRGLAGLFQHAPNNRPDGWSFVLQDFVTNASSRLQTRNEERRRSIDSDFEFINGRPVFEISNGQVQGITGIAADASADIVSGFASAEIKKDGKVTDEFKNAALKGLKNKALKFDRNTNIMISLAENICAILFYGFPPESESKMHPQLFRTSFHSNKDGILRHLGLLEEGNLHMTQSEIFEVVWEYCVIADQLINHTPSVKMRFDFANSTFRDGDSVVGAEPETYREAAEVYNLSPAITSLGRLSSAVTRVRRTANRYLPPDIMDRTDVKGGPGTRVYLQQTFGANDPAGASQRKEELTNDLYDLAARAAVYFKQAEKEISKEPHFKLILEKEDGEPSNSYELLADGFKLGFLDHVTISSDFAAHSLHFMEPKDPAARNQINNISDASNTMRFGNRAIILNNAIDAHVGLRSNAAFDKFDNAKRGISLIKATDTSREKIIPESREDRIAYLSNTNVSEYGPRPATGTTATRHLFTSLKIIPDSCFGFIYDLGLIDQNRRVGAQLTTFGVPDDHVYINANRGINQFNTTDAKEKVKEDIKVGGDDSLLKLNKFYSSQLDLTPPRIYRKLIRKFDGLAGVINAFKFFDTRDQFVSATQSLNSVNHGIFRIHQLKEPVRRQKKKIVVEITVVKESFQFLKALKAAPQQVFGWDGEVTVPIQDVIPCNAKYDNSRYPSNFYGDLVDVLATFFRGPDFETYAEHQARPSGDTRSLFLGPYYNYQTNDAKGQLNSFGEFMLRNVIGPIVPLNSANAGLILFSREHFGWQFDLLCKILSRYDRLNVENDPGGERSENFTRSVPPTSDGVRAAADRGHIGHMFASYMHEKNDYQYSLDLHQWLTDWQTSFYAGEVNWNEYFFFVSPSTTNPNPWFIRSNYAHYPTSNLPVSYYLSRYPNTPEKAILGSPFDGQMYGYIPELKNQGKANTDIGAFSTGRPEFRTSNRTGLKTRSEKIVVEIYLVKDNQSGSWSHYSTEPIFDDEINHPSVRPIEALFTTGRGQDEYQSILLRPAVIAGLQYKLAGQDPKYYGPEIPNTAPSSIDGYFVNDSLPFLPVYNWGKRFKQAIDGTLNQFMNSNDFGDFGQVYKIPTSEFLEMDDLEIDNYLRRKAVEMKEACVSPALTFLNRFRTAIESYISQRNSGPHPLTGAQASWLRKLPGKFPYFYDWRVQFPSLEVRFHGSVEPHEEDADIYIDLNWKYFKNKTKDDSSPRAVLFNEQFDQASLKNIFELERDYLSFLLSMRDYTDSCSEAFEAGMLALDKSIKSFHSDLPSNPDRPTESYIDSPNVRENPLNSLTGSPSKRDVIIEIKKFIENNGFLGVTPDTLASLDSIKNLYIEQYTPDSQNFDKNVSRLKSEGLKLYDISASHSHKVQLPFKLCPYDIREPYQIRVNRSLTDSGSPTEHWQEIERNLSLENHYGPAYLDDSKTRVCFVGIESGELQRIIDSPLVGYGDPSNRYQRNDHTNNHGVSYENARKFQVKLELFDFFRPWLSFEYSDTIIFSREKPYRISSPNPASKTLSYNHCNSPMIRNIFSGEVENMIPSTPTPSNFNGSADRYDLMDVFLKAYASKVIGLDFFSFMIPKQGTTPPISDYTIDTSPSSKLDTEAMLPEERNYQEYLNEYTKITFDLIKNAEQNGRFGDVKHLIKYFFDRHIGQDSLASASSIAGADLDIRHYDEHGRSTLVSGESGFGGLFTMGVTDVSDPDFPKFFPYKFSTPITETSLAAAEILTTINEYTANIMREFRQGFAFDRIVGIPYKMSNFKIIKKVRTELSGEPVDLSNLDDAHYKNNNGVLELTPEFFNYLKVKLPYLDKNEETDGVFVAEGSLYPLTLRAKICRVEEN